MIKNLDLKTLKSFDDVWSRFDQTSLKAEEAEKVFDEYFAVLPWASLLPDAEGFDMGCGRRAIWMAPLAGRLNCIDPYAAIKLARASLAEAHNVKFHTGLVDDPVLKPVARFLVSHLGCYTTFPTLRLQFVCT
jgi:hypothetical protein